LHYDSIATHDAKTKPNIRDLTQSHLGCIAYCQKTSPINLYLRTKFHSIQKTFSGKMNRHWDRSYYVDSK